MTKITITAFVCLLAGCAPTIFTDSAENTRGEINAPLQAGDMKPVTQIENKSPSERFENNLLQHIASLPLARAAKLEVDRAQADLDLIDISLGPNFTFSTDLGGRKESDTEDLGAVARVQGSKAFYDSGRSELQKAIARNAVKTASLDYVATLNTGMFDAIKLETDEAYAQDLAAHLKSKQLEYEENRNLINMAAQSGVITSLELLTLNEKLIGLERREIEIQKLKNTIEVERLKNDLGKLKDFDFQLAPQKIETSLKTWQNNLAVLGLKSEVSAAELQLELEMLGKSVSADLAMRLSQETSSDAEPEIFAGFQVTLPMYDNGKTDKRVSMAETTIRILKNELERLEVDTKAQTSLWAKEISIHDQKIASIDNEISNSKNKISELEKTLNAGKTSLMDVVNEKLNLASLETSKIDEIHNFRLMTLELLRSQGALCLAISACSELFEILPK